MFDTGSFYRLVAMLIRYGRSRGVSCLSRANRNFTDFKFLLKYKDNGRGCVVVIPRWCSQNLAKVAVCGAHFVKHLKVLATYT